MPTLLRCGTDVQGTVVDSKRPIEADLIDGVCDPKPPNSRRDPAVASLRRCLRFEPAGDGGGSERSQRRWS
jgi:hypothetical protein